MAESSEDDASVILDFDGVNSTTIHIQESPDAEYEDEWGYSLVKSLRGKSSGRRLKRKLFKFSVFQLICGFALLIITIEESQNFKDTRYFSTAPYGATLQDLMWCVSIPGFFMGLVTLTAVRYWASLTTNRKLLCGLLRIYMFAFFLIFLFTLWCTCALFMTFAHIRDWGESVTLALVYPYYISTVIFIMPFLAVQLLYTLDVSYLVSELELGGNLQEPNPPDNVMDLSDVTLAQSCIFVCAMPCIMCVQLSDLVGAVMRAYQRHYRDQPMTAIPHNDKKKKQPTAVPNKNRGIGRRVWKTLTRYFRGAKQKEVRPTGRSGPDQLELVNLEKDREQEERMERERVLREQEDRRRLVEFEEAAAQAELQRKQEQQLFEAARALNERRIREEEEALRRNLEQSAEEEKDGDSEKWDAIMSVPAFKSVWSSLSTAGSFQCKLKALPVLQALVDHLKRQGFHIVFAANPTPTDVEIGVSNIRKAAEETWFMARFLATATSFSAVMKAQNPEQVTAYVKKFALAKVLKIDAGNAK